MSEPAREHSSDGKSDGKNEERKGKRKQIGYLQLEWICPQCHTRNPGDKAICVTCGLPHPEDVGFVPPLHPTILTTGTAAEAAAALVEAGADIHCPWCGVRNRATARQCTQCQGSLAGGDAREHGEDLGNLDLDARPDVICASCHTVSAGDSRYCIMCGAPLVDEPAREEPPPALAPAVAEPSTPVAEPASSAEMSDATDEEASVLPQVLATAAAVLPGVTKGLSRRTQLWITIGLLVAIGALLLYGWWQRQPKTLTATPVELSWQRTIEIESQSSILLSGWHDELPAGVAPLSCEMRPRSLSEEPENTDAVEICGTPYAVDTGTGVAEVFQDCLYQVNEEFCTWEGSEWKAAPALVSEGKSQSPVWPEVGETQREIGRTEGYTCTLRAGEREFTIVLAGETYTTCSPETPWRIEIDGDGALVDAAPISAAGE